MQFNRLLITQPTVSANSPLWVKRICAWLFCFVSNISENLAVVKLVKSESLSRCCRVDANLCLFNLPQLNSPVQWLLPGFVYLRLKVHLLDYACIFLIPAACISHSNLDSVNVDSVNLGNQSIVQRTGNCQASGQLLDDRRQLSKLNHIIAKEVCFVSIHSRAFFWQVNRTSFESVVPLFPRLFPVSWSLLAFHASYANSLCRLTGNRFWSRPKPLTQNGIDPSPTFHPFSILTIFRFLSFFRCIASFHSRGPTDERRRVLSIRISALYRCTVKVMRPLHKTQRIKVLFLAWWISFSNFSLSF